MDVMGTHSLLDISQISKTNMNVPTYVVSSSHTGYYYYYYYIGFIRETSEIILVQIFLGTRKK